MLFFLGGGGGCFWCFIFPFLFLSIQRSIILFQMFCFEKRMVCGLLRQLFSCLLVIWIADWSLPIEEEILFLKTKCSIKFKVRIGKVFIPWWCIAQENWCVHSYGVKSFSFTKTSYFFPPITSATWPAIMYIKLL